MHKLIKNIIFYFNKHNLNNLKIRIIGKQYIINAINYLPCLFNV